MPDKIFASICFMRHEGFYMTGFNFRDLCITTSFVRFLRQAQILILEILNIFLRLKFSPSLNSNKIGGFSKVSFRRFTGLLAAGLLLFACPAAAVQTSDTSGKDFTENSAKDFMLIADVNASWAYSSLKHSDSLSGGMIDALLAATWKMKEDRFFILKYDGGYEKKLDFYSDDDGLRPRTEFQEHTLTPMLRIGISRAKGISLIPSFFYTATLNKDTQSTDWDDGLYNYYDVGGGIDCEIRNIDFSGGNGILTFGMQYYKRHYPNFVSLLDIAVDNPYLGLVSALDTEKDEKDYGGILARMEYLWVSASSLSWRAEYSVLYKHLDDKKVVDMNGSLTDTNQVDYLHTLTGNIAYDLTRHTHAGLTLAAELNDSNQNFFDGMNNYDYAYHISTRDYYDYYGYGIQPEITYAFSKIPVTLKANYAFHKTRYFHRKARTAEGDYQTRKQKDTLHSFCIGAGYEISDQWHIHADWTNTRSDSNNADERYYLYHYTLDVFSFGISFHY
jgi:hypothetical protein